jgi:ribosomal protein RSM22 (predicted rRNA methylase)
MIARPTYPPTLEQWWLGEARRLLHARNDEGVFATLADTVAALSDRFTTGRAEGSVAYIDNPRARAAYGLFFFPQTYVRTLFCLDEVLHRSGWRPSGISLRIADLGAGTGSTGLAVAERLGRLAANLHLTAIDTSLASLEAAERMVEDRSKLWPGLTMTLQQDDLAAFADRSESWDVIVSGFSVNERFENEEDGVADAWLTKLLGRLAPGGLLLLIDPAMAKTSLRLQRFRDAVALNEDFRVLAPCLHARPCPMLAQAGAGVFCHEVRSWKPPGTLQYLNRHLFRSVHLLKYSFVAVARAPLPAATVDPDAARMVSPLMDLKGRSRGDVCAADGALRCHEILARHADKSLKHTERGDTLLWKTRRLLGDGTTTRAEAAERVFGFE